MADTQSPDDETGSETSPDDVGERTELSPDISPKHDEDGVRIPNAQHRLRYLIQDRFPDVPPPDLADLSAVPSTLDPVAFEAAVEAAYRDGASVTDPHVAAAVRARQLSDLHRRNDLERAKLQPTREVASES